MPAIPPMTPPTMAPVWDLPPDKEFVGAGLANVGFVIRGFVVSGLVEFGVDGKDVGWVTRATLCEKIVSRRESLKPPDGDD